MYRLALSGLGFAEFRVKPQGLDSHRGLSVGFIASGLPEILASLPSIHSVPLVIHFKVISWLPATGCESWVCTGQNPATLLHSTIRNLLHYPFRV